LDWREGWRKFHGEEVHTLYSVIKFIKVIKPRRLRWAGHIACIDNGKLFEGLSRKT
jgi:hypothetical protein